MAALAAEEDMVVLEVEDTADLLLNTTEDTGDMVVDMEVDTVEDMVAVMVDMPNLPPMAPLHKTTAPNHVVELKAEDTMLTLLKAMSSNPELKVVDMVPTLVTPGLSARTTLTADRCGSFCR